jgi:hypothetical protein
MDIHAYVDCYAPKSERWYAVDRETYDGAEDSSNRNRVGHGATREAAIADLLELLEDEL